MGLNSVNSALIISIPPVLQYPYTPNWFLSCCRMNDFNQAPGVLCVFRCSIFDRPEAIEKLAGSFHRLSEKQFRTMYLAEYRERTTP